MKFPIRLIPVILITALTVFYVLNRSHPIQLLSTSIPARTQLNQIAVLVAANDPSQGHSDTPRSEAHFISELAPHVDEIREEVRKNPEETPPSLLLFASKMGKRFQIATLSLSNATGFFDELNSCLEDARPIATTARALCLREGERLTHYYPALQGNYDLLALKAAPEVRNLALRGRVSGKFSR